MKKAINNIPLALLLIFAFYVLLLLLRISNGNFYLVDSLEYLEAAKHFLNHGFFTDLSPIVSKRLFVYPLFLLLSITFNPYVILLFQAVLLYFSFFIFYKIIEHHKVKLNFIATSFIIATPSLFIYSQLVMSEIIVLFLVTMLFYLFMVNFSWKKIKYIQIILVLLAFTKPVFYPFVFVNFFLMLYYFYKVKRFNFWIFLPVTAVLLYINYNDYKFGNKHFSSMENKNLIHYNLYYFKSSSESKQVADNWISEIDRKVENLNDAQKNKIYKSIAKEEISNHFLAYSWYQFLTGIRGVIDPGRFDLMTFYKKEDGKQGFLKILNGNKSWKILFSNTSVLVIYFFLIPIFLFSLLKWFFFVKFFVSKKRDFSNYYILILIIYSVLVTGPVNCSRYMMPLQLIIITFTLLSINKKHISAN
jgi:hypothetical protein